MCVVGGPHVGTFENVSVTCVYDDSNFQLHLLNYS